MPKEYHCSNCGNSNIFDDKGELRYVCPNCGAPFTNVGETRKEIERDLKTERIEDRIKTAFGGIGGIVMSVVAFVIALDEGGAWWLGALLFLSIGVWLIWLAIKGDTPK